MSAEPATGVLAVYDGSETSARALDTAISRAAERSAPLGILVVIPPRLWRGREGQFDMPPDLHDEGFAKGLLDQATKLCAERGVQAGGIVRSGPPATVIVEEAGHGYDLVVLGERPNLTGAPTLASIVRERLTISIEIVEEA